MMNMTIRLKMMKFLSLLEIMNNYNFSDDYYYNKILIYLFKN